MTVPNVTDYKTYKDLSSGAHFKLNGSTYTKGSEPANIKSQLHTMKANASAKKRNNQKFENERGAAHNAANVHAQHQTQRNHTQQVHAQHQAARNNASQNSAPKGNGSKNSTSTGSQNSSNAPKGNSNDQPKLNKAKNKPVNLNTVTLSNMAKHWIEIQQVTSSADTLQFNNNWSRDLDVFYVNDGSKLSLNPGIMNDEPYGQGKNPSGSATPGYDKVYAEIDAFKIGDTGNYVLDIFPANKLSLEKAEEIPNDAQRKATLKKVSFRAMPVAYLTDNFVKATNQDGSLKHDANGNPVYEISKTTPYAVVYRGQANYHNPYEETADWYRKPVLSSDSKAKENGVNVADHSKAIALLEGLNYYLRGIDFVSYDYNTTNNIQYVDDMVDEIANSVVPEGLDGINLSNAKLQTLLPNGIMSAKDINAGGEPENNQETGEDEIVVNDGNPSNPHLTNRAKRVMGDLGINDQDPDSPSNPNPQG